MSNYNYFTNKPLTERCIYCNKWLDESRRTSRAKYCNPKCARRYLTGVKIKEGKNASKS